MSVGLQTCRRVPLHPEALEGRIVPSTFTVINLADDGAGSLRNAVALADANPGPDLVNFAPGVQGTITLTDGEIAIHSDVTINGPGAGVITVSGNDAMRVFEVIGGADESTRLTVTLAGLTVSHGRETEGAGVLSTDYSSLTLSHVVLSNNHALGDLFNFALGGGVASLGNYGRLTIANCLVAENSAENSSGPGAFGGGVYGGVESLTITNSMISDNSASSGDSAQGGGIYAGLGDGSISIQNCAFTRNQAVGGSSTSGGGAHLTNGYSRADVEHCTFTDNRAVAGAGGQGHGGAIYAVTGDRLDVRASAFVGNSAIGGDGSSGTGDAQGGAISAVGVGAGSISDTLFQGNRAVAGSNGTFENTAYGGAVFNQVGALEITRCTLSGNQAVGGNNCHGGRPTDPWGEAGGAHGGAIANTFGGQLVVRHSTITGNQAIGGSGNTNQARLTFVGTATGGGIDNSVGLLAQIPPPPARLTVVDCRVTSNTAVGGDDNAGSGSIVLAGDAFGGGIANYLGVSTTIDSSVVRRNQALGGVGNLNNGAPGSLAAGGGVFNGLGSVDMNPFPVLPPSIVTIGSSRLRYNRAQGGDGLVGQGGGDGWGGAIATLFDGTTSVAGSILANNVAVGGAGGDARDGGNGLGGGTYNDSSSVLAIATSLVTRNQALGGAAGISAGPGNGVGGGVYNLGQFTLDAGSLVIGNFASTSNNDIFG